MPEGQENAKPPIVNKVAEVVRRKLSSVKSFLTGGASSNRPTLEEQLQKSGRPTSDSTNERPTTEDVVREYRMQFIAEREPQSIADAEKRADEAQKGGNFYEMDAAHLNYLIAQKDFQTAANFRAHIIEKRREDRERDPNMLIEAGEELRKAEAEGDEIAIDVARVKLLDMQGRLEEAESIRKTIIDRGYYSRLGIF